VNTIWDDPITPMVVVGSAELRLRFLLGKTPSNPLPKFVVDPISTPTLTTFVLGATTISTLVVVMTTLGD
jgi:hypothetical protein